MPRKEKTNAKTWERDRRNRMNLYFKTLGDLLPPSQDGKNRNKVDILIQASKYIKDLTNRTEELFNTNAVDAHKEELTRLKKLVAQLYSRTQLLSALLKDAGITVPAEPALEKISPLKWSNKINVEDAEKYLDRFKERKKPEKRRNSTGLKIPLNKKIKASVIDASSNKNNNNSKDILEIIGPVEDQENHVGSNIDDKNLEDKSNESSSKNAEVRNNSDSVSSEPAIESSAGPKSSTGIRKLESRKKLKRKTSITKDNPAKKTTKTTRKSSASKSYPPSITLSSTSTSQNSSIANLVSGTLILSNGKLMPLITPLASTNILVNANASNPQQSNQQQSQLIISNNQTPTSPMIVMQSVDCNNIKNVSVQNQNVINAVQKVTLNTIPSIRTNVAINSHDWVSNVKTIIEATKIGGRKGILPKGKEITKTTMAYKVPIPVVRRDIKTLNSKSVSDSKNDKSDSKSKKPKGGKSCSQSKKTDKAKSTPKSTKEKLTEGPGKEDQSSVDNQVSTSTEVIKKLPETCESIGSLRDVVEKIGEDIGEVNRENPKTNESGRSNVNENEHETTKVKVLNAESNEVKDSADNNVTKTFDLPPEMDCVNENKSTEQITSVATEITAAAVASTSAVELTTESLTIEKVIEADINKVTKVKEVCDLNTRFNLLTESSDNSTIDSTKIILNLDTNTTTTMKSETAIKESSPATADTDTVPAATSEIKEDKLIKEPKTLFSNDNSFVPISNRDLHSDLSNDLFASLQVPSNSHNPESISPTAAFLMAFPLVSSVNGKTEVLEEDLKYHSQTPPMLLQIGAIEPNSFKVKSDDIKSNDKSQKHGETEAKSDDTCTKSLPKIVNSETFKDKLYRIVPYSKPLATSVNSLTNSSTSSVNSMTGVSSNLNSRTNLTDCDIDSSKKINEKSSTALSKYDNNVHSSSNNNNGNNNNNNNDNNTNNLIINSTGDNAKLSKYNSSTRYQTTLLTDYTSNYTNFTGNNTEHNQQMLPIDNSRVYTTSNDAINVPYQYSSQDQRVFVENHESSNYAAHNKETVFHDQLTRSYATNLNKNSTVTDYHNYLINKESRNEIQTQTQNQGQTLDPNYNNSNKQTPTKTGPVKIGEQFRISGDKISTEHFGASALKIPESEHYDVTAGVKVTDNYSGHYIPYARDDKKVFDGNLHNNTNTTTTTNNNNSKSHGQISTHYSHQVPPQMQQKQPQQQSVANNVKPTAQSSSNFSVLSWTTISPNNNSNNNNNNSSNNDNNNNDNHSNNNSNNDNANSNTTNTTSNNNNTNNNNNSSNSSGNNNNAASSSNTNSNSASNKPTKTKNNSNNLVRFEQNPEQNPSENKTICENFNYPSLHKNAGFNNTLTGQSFSADLSLTGVEKKTKLTTDKPKSVATTQKSRNQNQSSVEDYGNNKITSKKFTMDTNYTQEFSLDQQQRHTTKSHQVTSKTDTKSYNNYDATIAFDIPESVNSSKCSTDIYSGNYKYDKEHIKYHQPILHDPYASKQSQQQSQPQQQQSQQQLKSKPIQQQQQTVRPPVNWMMPPEIKHNTNMPDIILPPIGKELEFCQNNIFSQPPTYNQPAAASNQFYNNYDVAVSAAGFPNVSTLQSDSRRLADTTTYYPEDQHFSWSPTKNPQNTDHAQVIKSIEQQQHQQQQQQQVVPSTLPTLVGDLALGTVAEKSSTFMFGQPRNDLTQSKPVKDKEFAVMNDQNVQHSVQGGSFLSVSQLVEHEKAEKHQQHSHGHPLHQQQHQQPQTRKHQRKSNTSPRTTGRRQMEMRKTDQLQQQLEEQKISHGFPGGSDAYQQQKYQQQDGLWRNRNCKSNYTAEALIGVNTSSSIQDNNHPDKQLHAIKFSTDYSQNKFPSGLSTDMVMPPINYLTNPEDGNGYGQVMNQNFNHTSYTYSPNANIYPPTNFIAGISAGNTPSSYMMPLHDNPADYLEANSFLLPNVATNVGNPPKSTVDMSTSATVSTTRVSASTTTANGKNTHYGNGGKNHQNCENKRNYAGVSKKSKKKSDLMHMDFSVPGVTMEDYPHHHHHHHHHHHGHSSTFLPPPPPPPTHANSLYQNPPHSMGMGLTSNSNRTRSMGSNSVAMTHHPSGTSLTNFNLSTIFPEINDKIPGYKPPNIPPGLSQPSNHSTTSYPQRINYPANNTLGHIPQVSEGTQFTSDLPAPPPTSLHYKTT